MQDSWLSDKANEIQHFANRNGMRNFYNSLSSQPPQAQPLPLCKWVNIDYQKKKFFTRWTEQFNSDAIPTFEETRNAICLLSKGKSTWLRLNSCSNLLVKEVTKQCCVLHLCLPDKGLCYPKQRWLLENHGP